MLVFVSHVILFHPEFNIPGSRFGYAGVGFFFVLSGFILTYVYADRRPVKLIDFYRRRIARVWPLHLVTTLIVLFAVVGTEQQFSRPWGTAKFLANVFLLQSWIPEQTWVFSINGPAWSLSVEAFFYLLFPLLLMGGARSLLMKFVVYFLVTISVLVMFDFGFIEGLSKMAMRTVIHVNPLFRLYDFCVGMISGFAFLKYSSNPAVSSRLQRPWGPLLALLLCVAYYLVFHWLIADIHQDLGALLTWFRIVAPAPVFAIAVFAFANTLDGSIWSRLLSNRIMVYLGELSFGFYLIHQPVLRVIDRFRLADSSDAVYWMIGGSLCLSLAASVVLRHVVEVPAQKFILNSDGHGLTTGRFKGLLSGFGQLLTGLPGLSAVCLGLAAMAMIQHGKFDYFDEASIQQVVSNSAAEFHDVQFDQDAVLKGLKMTIQPDDSRQLEMVWDLKRGRRPTRFIHICDEQGKILRQGNENRDLFENVSGDRTVLDSVLLTTKELDGAQAIWVGFYDVERKSAPVVKNGIATKKHRLKVIQFTTTLKAP